MAIHVLGVYVLYDGTLYYQGNCCSLFPNTHRCLSVHMHEAEGDSCLQRCGFTVWNVCYIAFCHLELRGGAKFFFFFGSLVDLWLEHCNFTNIIT
jgi:hypothetical protein